MGSGYRTFTAGEVLTASNVQNYLQDQAVMVFAGTAARSSAIGTANFEEGMLTYLTDVDKLQVYTGAAFADVYPAAATNQGLTLVNTTSFSGVASQSINDIFSATYENYLFVANIEGSNQGVNFTARLRVSGTDASGADYENQQLYVTSTTVGGGRQNGTTNFFLGTNQNNNRNAFQLTLFEPFLARPTSYQSHFFRG